jgi:hypothetical protein
MVCNFSYKITSAKKEKMYANYLLFNWFWQFFTFHCSSSERERERERSRDREERKALQSVLRDLQKSVIFIYTPNLFLMNYLYYLLWHLGEYYG